MKCTPSLNTLVLAAVLLLFGASSLLRAQNAEIRNLRVQQQYATMFITYDLVGEEDAYDITLNMRRSSNPAAPYSPTQVSGDIGPDVVPGTGKRISWDLAREFPDGIDAAEEFSLSMHAQYHMGFFEKYSYYLGGGAVGMGAALYLILSGEGASAPSALPDPQGRPEKW